MRSNRDRASAAVRGKNSGGLLAWGTGFVLFVLGSLAAGPPASSAAPAAGVDRDGRRWIGTWATAPQRPRAGRVQTFRNQTLRLIVRASAGGKEVRIKVSNTFGDRALLVGGAHLARRLSGPNTDPTTDRVLTFGRNASVRIATGDIAVSDPVALEVPALSELAVSLFLPEETPATTLHVLALQTSYVSSEGDAAAKANFPVARTIDVWPFLTGVDVAASPRGAAIVAFGSSLTDGDGSTTDANRRWPDVLAERLLKASPKRELGVLNEGIIGNRLLSDIRSPRQAGGPFEAVLEKLAPLLGETGLARFDRDVLAQAGVRYVVLGLGINDILFPGAFIPASEAVTAESLIAGNRQLISRAHKAGVRAIGTTMPPVEDATFRSPTIHFYTPEKEAVRQEVNAWIRTSGEFDAVIDFDEPVRDPGRPTRILPAFDSGDHLHPNDAGYVASGNVIPLTLFEDR